MVSARSFEGRAPCPIPVPELEPEEWRNRKRTLVDLASRTAVVTLVILLGIGISGVAVSKVTTSTPSVTRQVSQSHHADQQSSTNTSSTTGATTTSSPPTTTTFASRSVPNSVSTPAPTTATMPSSSLISSPSAVIQASGTQLYLNGSPYNFVGVDAYEAATEWGVNAGVWRGLE